jgi:hypothetical protein
MNIMIMITLEQTARLSLMRLGRVKKDNTHRGTYDSISTDLNRILLRRNDVNQNLIKDR